MQAIDGLYINEKELVEMSSANIMSHIAAQALKKPYNEHGSRPWLMHCGDPSLEETLFKVYERDGDPALLIAFMKLHDKHFSRHSFTKFARMMTTSTKVSARMVQKFMDKLHEAVPPKTVLADADPEKLKILSSNHYVLDF